MGRPSEAAKADRAKHTKLAEIMNAVLFLIRLFELSGATTLGS